MTNWQNLRKQQTQSREWKIKWSHLFGQRKWQFIRHGEKKKCLKIICTLLRTGEKLKSYLVNNGHLILIEICSYIKLHLFIISMFFLLLLFLLALKHCWIALGFKQSIVLFFFHVAFWWIGTVSTVDGALYFVVVVFNSLFVCRMAFQSGWSIWKRSNYIYKHRLSLSESTVDHKVST